MKNIVFSQKQACLYLNIGYEFWLPTSKLQTSYLPSHFFAQQKDMAVVGERRAEDVYIATVCELQSST